MASVANIGNADLAQLSGVPTLRNGLEAAVGLAERVGGLLYTTTKSVLVIPEDVARPSREQFRASTSDAQGVAGASAGPDPSGSGAQGAAASGEGGQIVELNLGRDGDRVDPGVIGAAI